MSTRRGNGAEVEPERKRRDNGEGTFGIRPDGRHYGQKLLGILPNGKPYRPMVYGASLTEVKGKLRTKEQEWLKGQVAMAPDKLTVADYLADWIEAAAVSLRPITLQNYRRTIKNHLTPGIGRIRLKDLTALHVQRLYADLSRRLAPSSVGHVHTVLGAAMSQAVEWDYLTKNPCSRRRVKLPKGPKSKIHVFTGEQLAQLAKSLDGHKYRNLVLLALASGARRGELIALRWQDVDLETGEIRIVRTIEYIDKQSHYEDPKSDAGIRRIPLPTDAVELLRAHRRAQAENRLKVGPQWHDLDLVFCQRDGSTFIPDAVSSWFKQWMPRKGLPRELSFHDCRHTHATILLAANVHPKVVQERLGHATIAETLDTYSHVVPTMQAEVAKLLNHILGNILLPTADKGRR